MNSLVETLNQWGGNFSDFAWPLFGQSSLLIAALFALDFLWRRKIRASVRYALWLVVLVKLILPPTFALPTSPAWWLHKNSPAIPIGPQMQNYIISYDQSPLPEIPPNPLPAFFPPKPALTLAAWWLVVSVFVSVVLLAYLLVRWVRISRQVRRAEISERLAALVAEAQTIIGRKKSVPVKLTANAMSPAVCGLFRPAILIPQTLAEKFSDGQLRAVLLHELIHLRRGDVWLNFLQSLLQIVYWWHPLVWLTNARLRRVREEAVDDAVMLALRSEAETYAPTLLEVAKLALNRPLASLGLVGILESRSALRQRIERLVDFRPPRRAGLTLVSLLGILAFTAVAVPMGGAPGPVENQSSAAPVVSVPSVVTQNTNINPPQVLIEAAFYQMGAADFDETISGLKLNPAAQGGNLWWSASPEKFSHLTENLKSSGLKAIQRPRIQTGGGQPAQFYVGNGTNGVELDCLPLVTNGLVDLTIQSRIIWKSVNVLTTNQFNGNVSSANHGGFVFRINDAAGSNVVVIVGVKILPDVQATKISGILTNPNFQKVLAELQKRTGVETMAEPEVVTTSGRLASGRGVNGISLNEFAAIQERMAKEPAGRTNQVAPQIHIKARFIEVPKGTLDGMEKIIAIPNQTNQSAGLVGILTSENFKTALHTLETRKDVEMLAEPEVVTTSGRQTQMRATQAITVIANLAFQETAANSTVSPQTGQVETGPVFDTIPDVLSDGYTINLTAIASVTEFLGYDRTTNTEAAYTSSGEKVDLPAIKPSFQVQQAVENLNLWDGQTLVMKGLIPPQAQSLNEKYPDVPLLSQRYQSQTEPKKELVVFVTVDIVDPAGKRIHSDAEMPFAQTGIPPQPPK